MWLGGGLVCKWRPHYTHSSKSYSFLKSYRHGVTRKNHTTISSWSCSRTYKALIMVKRGFLRAILKEHQTQGQYHYIGNSNAVAATLLPTDSARMSTHSALDSFRVNPLSSGTTLVAEVSGSLQQRASLHKFKKKLSGSLLQHVAGIGSSPGHRR